MTATTNLNIRTDRELKNECERIYSELGLNMTTAINMFLRATVRENGIPFSVKIDSPNVTTINYLLLFLLSKKHIQHSFQKNYTATQQHIPLKAG